MIRTAPTSTLFPYTTLFRSTATRIAVLAAAGPLVSSLGALAETLRSKGDEFESSVSASARSEEHTSELQSLRHLVCRLLLEKKKEGRSHIYVGHANKQHEIR